MPCAAKIVLLGASAAGKSAVLTRLVRDRFDIESIPTIGAAFANHTLESDPPRVVGIWDTAGQERYAALAPMYYRNSDVAIAIYDVASAKSFERAKRWIITLKAAHPAMPLALVANKIDLVPDPSACASVARSFAADLDCQYLEVSAKTGSNFEHLNDLLILLTDGVQPKETYVSLPPIEENPRMNCC